ncbi:MAG: molybdenum cofactor guanylyltransferase [Bryobacteraceae bacterium]
MSRAGFVLVGGRSTRMGRDKARLPFRNGMLVEHIAREVEKAAGSVWLVGAPERHRDLLWPAIPDLFPGAGPVAGIHAALASGRADWNLVVACDMPEIAAPLLRELLDAAVQAGKPALAPLSPGDQIQALCAVYHRDCLPVFEQALREGRRRLRDVIAELDMALWPVAEPRWFRNLNTPDEWVAFAGR